MNMNSAFYTNYFIKNVHEKYTNAVQEFMFWRRGSFLPPHKKDIYIKKFLQEEEDQFYTEGIFTLPSVQFAITTRCTLRCQDCSVMIPRFADTDVPHIEMTFPQFRESLDTLLAGVDHIRSVLILGGEPLLHRELPEIVAYAARQEKIGLVDIVTNCTLLPSQALLDAVAQYRHKTFFGLSNYTKNPEVAALVKREQIIALLKANDIKHSLDSGTGKWFRYSLEKCDISPNEIKSIFAGCQWHHCLYVLGGDLAVCPRSLIGHRLGAFALDDADIISLLRDDSRGGNDSETRDIRRQLLAFFEKETLDACRYCRRHAELVEPALQMKP